MFCSLDDLTTALEDWIKHLERHRPALQVDQDRRPDHRPHLPLLLTHLRTGTLGGVDRRLDQRRRRSRASSARSSMSSPPSGRPGRRRPRRPRAGPRLAAASSVSPFYTVMPEVKVKTNRTQTMLDVRIPRATGPPPRPSGPPGRDRAPSRHHVPSGAHATRTAHDHAGCPRNPPAIGTQCRRRHHAEALASLDDDEATTLGMRARDLTRAVEKSRARLRCTCSTSAGGRPQPPVPGPDRARHPDRASARDVRPAAGGQVQVAAIPGR